MLHLQDCDTILVNVAFWKQIISETYMTKQQEHWKMVHKYIWSEAEISAFPYTHQYFCGKTIEDALKHLNYHLALKIKNMDPCTKISRTCSAVMAIFLYACKYCTLTAELENKISAMKMRCYRKLPKSHTKTTFPMMYCLTSFKGCFGKRFLENAPVDFVYYKCFFFNRWDAIVCKQNNVYAIESPLIQTSDSTPVKQISRSSNFSLLCDVPIFIC